MTVEDDRARDESIARLDREMDVALQLLGAMRCLLPVCPVCFRDPGVTCYYVQWMELVVLDVEHQMFAHPARILKAVEDGHADYDDVVKYFGENVPVWLTELGTAEDTGGRL